jgi:hypothetical protein
MVRVELCVNHVHGENCENFYLAGEAEGAWHGRSIGGKVLASSIG